MITIANQAPFLDGQGRIFKQGGLDSARTSGGLEPFELVQSLRFPGCQPGLDTRAGWQGVSRAPSGRGASPDPCDPRPQAAPGRMTGPGGWRRHRSDDCRCNSSTASSRSISSIEVSGAASHSANCRAPIGVADRSITLRSEPSRFCVASVRTSSRLRRVISSSPRVSVHRYGISRAMWPSDVFCVSRRYAISAPAAWTSKLRSSTPNPPSVLVANCSNNVFRACSG